MFNIGELIKRKTLSNNTRSFSVIVDKTKDNYTVYNNSLKCLQLIAVPVIEGMYSKVYNNV
tara:strand:- start:329 stop:511 length:183 start_codon:yes stop_codon:yes gene_type:complete